MKRKFKQSLLSLSLATTLALTGCSNAFVGEDIASYPLGQKMTTAEAIDYYSNALKYDAVVKRNVQVHEETYEMHEVSVEKEARLKSLVKQCEEILGSDEYDNTDENKKLVSPDTYEYIRAMLDNDSLSNGNIIAVQAALGYYFVDVEYNVSPADYGEFKEPVNLVGLDGVFYLNYKDEYVVDTMFLKAIAKEMDEYFFKNKIKRHCVFLEDKLALEIQDGVDPVVYGTLSTYTESSSNIEGSTPSLYNGESEDETLSENDADTDDGTEVSDGEGADANTENEDGTAEETEDTTETEDTAVAEVYEQDSDNTRVVDEDIENTPYTITTPANRRLNTDIALINSVVGSNLKQRALLPQLDYLYDIPSVQGTMSGYGIYPSGSNGLRIFGFDRNSYGGKMTLRYVFKDDSKGTGDILGTNIYCTEETISNGASITDGNVLLPEILISEFEQLIERSDRAIMNNDLTGLTAGSTTGGLIYEDLGVGILRANKEKSTNILKYMSTIKQIVSRNTSNNSYLLDVETTVVEGPKDVDAYGTYTDRYYVTVQQQNDKFVITDYVRMSRVLVKEPPIDPDTNIQRKLVALNLAGPVSKENKDAIGELMTILYNVGTNRILNASVDEPKTITAGGEERTFTRGLRQVFTSDTSVMSQEDKDYLVSKLQTQLTRYGADITSIYSGQITEWIGGYENQVEFTTEEFIYYKAKGTGQYMQVYYLVSVNHDEWVIDERQVLNEAFYGSDESALIAEICERLYIPQ